jgi:hypothetical protein
MSVLNIHLLIFFFSSNHIKEHKSLLLMVCIVERVKPMEDFELKLPRSLIKLVKLHIILEYLFNENDIERVTGH